MKSSGNACKPTVQCSYSFRTSDELFEAPASDRSLESVASISSFAFDRLDIRDRIRSRPLICLERKNHG
ncbi:unnamed protein product [Mycena citricolor]|uniref:Uncharacterized protein n=1 Tax=Mycena citricolor TaxID=2018698 RepID=A0AAD2JX81_9AGAR|nr:unnamed protein product [Mycena citricolor]